MERLGIEFGGEGDDLGAADGARPEAEHVADLQIVEALGHRTLIGRGFQAVERRAAQTLNLNSITSPSATA